MTFLWPTWLWLMPALLLLPPLYLWLLRRRGKPALRYSGLAVIREASGSAPWRRHVPPALLWLACAALLLAAARPMAKLTLPWARTSIMLAMDVSLSMRVKDVLPTRLAAAQEAAKLFLRDLPKGIEVGLVTFAGSAQVAQAATLDRSALVAAIDAFQMQYGTAIGSAIVVCLAELFPEQGISLGDMTFGARQGLRSREEEKRAPTAAKPVTPVAPGSYGSAAILLLSDGRRTTGVDTLDAAKHMQLDEPTLREVARMTGGEYHHAGTAEELRSVYQDLRSRLQVQTRETEITAVLGLVGAILVVVAAGLSGLWFGRVG